MEQKVENSTFVVQAEKYESPRVEIIEIEVEDAVLTGVESMPVEEW